MSPCLRHACATTVAASAGLALSATFATFLALDSMPAKAGPAGGTVVGGSATISGAGSSSVTINQSSQNAIINWSTFNIGSGESVTFNQQLGSSSIALNRVTGGGGPSIINGTLTANGRVFIVNGDGVLIGRGASISTAGFLATTSDIRNADFMAGNFNFSIPGNPAASIVNLGHITAASGGFAALVAPGVRNSGTITATLGTVSLASGNAFTLDMYGDRLINLAVNDQIASSVIDVATGQTLKSLVSNTGKLAANGGRVELTAAAARAVVNSVINNRGVIEANSIGQHNGMVVLSAATAATKGAGLPTQTVKLSGKISVAGRRKGTTGGTVVVTGENIELKDAKIDASGRAGGGTVLIGGDTGGGNPSALAASIAGSALEPFAVPTASTVSIDAGSVINASATGRGNGGKVVVWSNQETSFAGTILAQGGARGGNGGFVETSSHGVLNFTGNVKTLAPAGDAGTLLLDPYDVTINSTYDIDGSFVNGVWTPSGPSSSYLSVATLENQLQNGNVVVTTGGAGSPGSDAGNINVDGIVTWGNNNSLTLSAYNNINFFSGASITNTAGGNLILRADNSATGIGTVTFANANQINYSGSTGLVSIYYNPTSYSNPTDFSSAVQTNGAVPGQFTAYMLVNSSADLTKVSQNLNGTYALGTNIDARSFAGFAAGATFNGVLNGNGGLGVNYTISNLTLSSSQTSNSYGLFPFIGTSGIVENLNLASATISAGANIQFIGVLAGQNEGTISDVTVTNSTVSGSTFIGIGAGGLVGQNTGTITGSSATFAVVTVGNSPSATELNFAGGLVGSNLGAIVNSQVADSSISGGSLSWVGGLVGQNGLSGSGGGAGTITSSYASVTVVQIVGSNSAAGGLAGSQAQGSTILDSQADVVVSASGQQNFVGGLVGQNSGTIAGSTAPSQSSTCTLGASYSCAGAGLADGVSLGQGNGPLGWAGGITGDNEGVIENTLSTINVIGNGDSVLGGIAGLVGNNGLILASISKGVVATGTGSGSVVGGVAGANAGAIVSSRSSGLVSAPSGSYLGGLVGVNVGQIQNSSSSSTVVGTGSQNVAGGLVGLNLGLIDPSTSSGNVISGADSIVGGFVGANGAFTNFPTGLISGSFPTGTISDGSMGTGSATGGPGSTVGSQVGQSFPTAGLPGFGTTATGCDSAVCFVLGQGIFGGGPTDNGTLTIYSQTQLIQDMTRDLTLATFTPGDVVDTAALNQPPPQRPQRPIGGPGGLLPPQFGPRFFAVPPPGTPFVPDEVVLHIPSSIPLAQLQAILQRLGLTVIASQPIELLGVTTYRMHIGNGASVAAVIRALAAYQIIAGAQANLIYVLTQQPAPELAQDPDLAGRTQEGDAAQYVLGKLGLFDLHRVLKGTNVTIAVIDPQIDVKHPDLDGVIAGQFDAVGGAVEKPHPHGTGMAGAIAAHRRLMGIAPSAQLYAVHAFSNNAATADSTTYNILKGLDWAAGKGVRVINMSFAGPRDPSLERALHTAHDKGIVLIAAAGNAGPKSPPLYPGADPNVIAVTATDIDDKVFSGANRGRYIAVAAPGVDILVPAPDATYQLTTGTSVASAEVSGIAALLLERNPKLTPEDIRRILEASARHPGSKERDDDLGFGLVDPAKAVQDVNDVRPTARQR